jgi:hypothetical protein
MLSIGVISSDFRRRKSPLRKRRVVKRQYHRVVQGRRRKRRNSRRFGNGKLIVLYFIVSLANSVSLSELLMRRVSFEAVILNL